MSISDKSPFVVGLTGGIGAGKSTICNTIEDMQIPIFDCDAKVHELYRRPDIVERLQSQYGPVGIHPRLHMAKMAWDNPTIREELEGIFLPLVGLEIMAFIDQHNDYQRKLVVIDAPTLLEHKLAGLVDWIVVVDAPAAERYDRVRGREGMTAEKFNKVVRSQVDDTERRRQAHSVIFNDGKLEDAVEQTQRIFGQLQGLLHG